MAARKRKTAAPKTVAKKQDADRTGARKSGIDERDPQSWLFTNPDGVSEEGFCFGVLRKIYNKRANSAYEFGFRKCHVGPDSEGADQAIWSPNVERVEVLLPPEASDELADPVTLLRQVDRVANPDEPALLTALTVPMNGVPHIHTGWERARAFACRIARERELAVVLILHCPARSGSGFAPHAHALIVPRRIGRFGLAQGIYDHELIHDDGQALLHGIWTEHCGTVS